jgi:methoxymalonate biosynthesis acyl carrier protein
MKNKIRKFIEGNLIILEAETEFSDSDNIFQLGYVNSLFAMKLLNFVEKEFEITLDNNDIDIKNFSSVENIITLINKYQLNKINS